MEFDDKKPAAPASSTAAATELYQFIDFHSVACSSQNVGTSLEDLSFALHPTESGWECGRFVSFPQEVIFKLHARTKLEYILIASKRGMSFSSLQVFIGDGLSGSFIDVNYHLAGEWREVTPAPVKIKCYGIGSFIKLVFKFPPEKTKDNPYGQVGLALFRVWGIPVSYYKGVKIEDLPETRPSKERIDKILIELGVPIDGPEWSHADSESYKYTPVDEDTRETLLALEKIRDQALRAEDFEKAGNVSKDIKKLLEIGAKILTLKRELSEAVSKEDFGRAVEIKERLVRLQNMRDAMDALYETPRYEDMIVMKRPSTATRKLQEKLEEEEKERLERERLRKIQDAKMHELEAKRLRDMEEKKRRLAEEEEMQRNQVKKEIAKIRKQKEVKKSPKPSPTAGKKAVKIVLPEEEKGRHDVVVLKKPKEQKVNDLAIKGRNDPLVSNVGDAELEPFLTPLLNAAGGPVKDLNEDALKTVLEKGLLDICGVRLWNAMHSESWRHREAAGTAFLQYLEAPLSSRFVGKTKRLFKTAMEIAYVCCNDKLLQIYFVGLKILATALGNPVCGEDIPLALVNNSVRRFVPLLITKISELNYRARDISMHTLISLFNHPSIELRILVDNLTDIADGKIPVEKQQWRLVLARLETMLSVLKEFGLNEKAWSWKALCQKLVFPSLSHQNPDVRYMCVELIITLYKLVGEDVKNELIKMKSVKASLLQMILEKMAESSAGNKRSVALKLPVKDLAPVEEEKEDLSNPPSALPK